MCAAEELLARDGFDRMSVDAIAQRAGASKATIYRWWQNKAAIVVEALLTAIEPEVAVPDSGDPARDLETLMRRTIHLFGSDKGRMIAVLIGRGQSDPEIAEAYRTHLLGPRRAAVRPIIERGIAAGLFRDDIDIEVAIDLIYGPLYERLLLGHAPLDEAFERSYPPIAVAALRRLTGAGG